MSGVRQVAVSPDEAELRFDRWCRKHFPALPHGQLQKLMRSGQFRLDGRRVKGSERLEPGQIVRVPPTAVHVEKGERPPVSPHDARFLADLIIHEDDELIVLNKPPGLAVQGGSKTVRHIDGMLDALARKGVRPRLVHRLDRDTSGVLVLARSAPTARTLMHAFQGHEVQKLYWAIVVGRPDRSSGLIDLRLGKSGAPGAERMTPDALDAKQAQTDFRLIATAGRIGALAGLVPLTGRTHQLRAHMAAIGNPICGDGKYGQGTPANAPPGLMLHAREIIVPLGRREVSVTAPISKLFQSGLDWLGIEPHGLKNAGLADWQPEDD